MNKVRRKINNQTQIDDEPSSSLSRSYLELSESGAIDLLSDTLQFHIDCLYSKFSSIFVKRKSLNKILSIVANLPFNQIQNTDLYSTLSGIILLLLIEKDKMMIYQLLKLFLLLSIDSSGEFNLPYQFNSSIFKIIFELSFHNSEEEDRKNCNLKEVSLSPKIITPNKNVNLYKNNNVSQTNQQEQQQHQHHQKDAVPSKIHSKRKFTSNKSPPTSLEKSVKYNNNNLSSPSHLTSSSTTTTTGPRNINLLFDAPQQEKEEEGGSKDTELTYSTDFNKYILDKTDTDSDSDSETRKIACFLTNRIMNRLITDSLLNNNNTLCKVFEDSIEVLNSYQNIVQEESNTINLFNSMNQLVEKLISSSNCNLLRSKPHKKIKSDTLVNVFKKSLKSDFFYADNNIFSILSPGDLVSLWLHLNLIEGLSYKNSSIQKVFIEEYKPLNVQNKRTPTTTTTTTTAPTLIDILFELLTITEISLLSFFHDLIYDNLPNDKTEGNTIFESGKKLLIVAEIDFFSVNSYDIFTACVKCTVNLTYQNSTVSTDILHICSNGYGNSKHGINQLTFYLDMFYQLRIQIKDKNCNSNNNNNNNNNNNSSSNNSEITVEHMISDLIVYLTTILMNIFESVQSVTTNYLLNQINFNVQFTEINLDDFEKFEISKGKINEYSHLTSLNPFVRFLMYILIRESSAFYEILLETDSSDQKEFSNFKRNDDVMDHVPVTEIFLSAHVILLIHSLLYIDGIYDPKETCKLLELLPYKSFWLPVRVLKAFVSLQEKTNILIVDNVITIVNVIKIMEKYNNMNILVI